MTHQATYRVEEAAELRTPRRRRDGAGASLLPVAVPGGEETGNIGVLLQISNAMVRIYKDGFGRGPTKARAQLCGPDTLVVMLEDSMTVVERNLVAMGEQKRVREARLFLLDALEDQFRACVERILGRRTVAFVSGIDTGRDVSIELFTLEARGLGDDGCTAGPGLGPRPAL